MPSLIGTLEKVNQCLRTICEIEAELLSGSLFSLFKKKNFAGMDLSLEVTSTRLYELIQRLREITQTVNQPSQNYIRILVLAIKYAESLRTTADCLRKINTRLGQKANGRSYSMSEYNYDYKTFRELQQNYSTIGYGLNTEFNLYGNELLLEENRNNLLK